MNQRIIRLPQVRDLVGLGKTAIYDKIKANTFPSPVKLGRVSGWVESEVQAWINSQIAASRSVANNGSNHVARSCQPLVLRSLSDQSS